MKPAKQKPTRATSKKSSEKKKPDSKKKQKDKDKKPSAKKDKKTKKEQAPTAGKQSAPAKPATKKAAAMSAAKKDDAKKPKAGSAKPAVKAATKTPAGQKPASPGQKKVATKAAAKPATKKPATTKVKSESKSGEKPAAPAGKKKAAVPARKSTAGSAPAVVAKKKGRTTTANKTTANKKTLPDIPAILLEGDEPSYSPRSGPGSRYDTGIPAPSDIGGSTDLVLPEAYGTKRIHLVARDPQWVYAHWDLTNEQLNTYNQLSRTGRLTLQIFESEVSGKPKVEIDVHPESRSWFAHVGKGGGEYFAVLGFHDKTGDWQQISVSESAETPPDSLSDDLEATFTSIPVSIPFSELIKVVREYAASEPKLAKALTLLQQADIPETAGFTLAMTPPTGSPRWSAAQQQALADAVSMDEVRRVWIGSEEVLELIKGREGLSSEAAIPPGGISSITSLSSPFGGEQPPGARGFWFNVNAELIIYGATEPDASVVIGDRLIKLREDGSFSYRFALPDGQYQLPIAATSADKVETRNANLDFARATKYHGDVGRHPQDPALKKPGPENVS